MTLPSTLVSVQIVAGSAVAAQADEPAPVDQTPPAEQTPPAAEQVPPLAEPAPPAEATPKGKLTGRAIDKGTKEGLPAATVIIKGPDGNQSFATELDGTFTLEL